MDKSRTALLIGEEGIEKLEKASVTIVGVGGVGGTTAVMLARAGIENITIIDFDKVSQSNVNRQIIANQKTIGRAKVEVLKEMLEDINPDIKVTAINDRLTSENIEKYIVPCSVVVDAIDSVGDKIALIVYCKKHNINIISAMGAGNRCDIPQFSLMDIFKTHDDGLAKVVRKKLREEGIKNLDVVCSLSKPVYSGKTIGSISYYPNMCGCTLSAVVINKILGGEYENSK